jgi:hypothetical protein
MKGRSADIARDIDNQIAGETVDSMLNRLDRFAVPEPGQAETEALIAYLRPLMPKPSPAPTARFRDVALMEPRSSMLRALVPQVRLFRPVWWLGSLLVVLMSLGLAEPLAAEGIPLSALAPLLIIAGVGYAFGSLRGGALELELSCPITPAQAALGRMLVVLGYGLALGAATALVYGGPALPLLLGWCASLLFFAGLMLALTVFTGTSGAAALSLLVWGAQLLFRETRLTLFVQPDAPGWLHVQLVALAAGGLLLPFALFRSRLLVRREDR